MANKPDSNAASSRRCRGETDTHGASEWTTDTELVREFDRPVNVIDAVSLTICEAVEEWSELSETPSLHEFVDVEHLDGLFKTTASGDSGWVPSATFPFQSCRVTLLYGSSVRVIIERDT